MRLARWPGGAWLVACVRDAKSVERLCTPHAVDPGCIGRRALLAASAKETYLSDGRGMAGSSLAALARWRPPVDHSVGREARADSESGR